MRNPYYRSAVAARKMLEAHSVKELQQMPRQFHGWYGKLPTTTTLIRDFLGDGTRELMIPLLQETDIVVTHPAVKSMYEGSPATVVTLREIQKLQRPTNCDRVIIDTEMPTFRSKQFKSLRSLCRGKVVLFATLIRFERVIEINTIRRFAK